MVLDGFPAGANVGYNIEREDRVALDRQLVDMPDLDALVSEPLYYEDLKDSIRTENQYSIGSCQGWSLTTCMEFLNLVLTGDTRLQLSAWFAYRCTQKIDGISGDRGSTINGGIRLAKTKGLCQESLCPYPNPPRYYKQLNPMGSAEPQELFDDAKKRTLQSAVRIHDVRTADKFMNAGLGAIHVGCTWTRDFDTPIVESYGGRGGGGHAWPVLCRSNRVCTRTGLRYFWMLNSWGKRWTNSQDGWKEIAPIALDKILKHHNTAAVGCSDLKVEDMKPRNLDWVRNGVASTIKDRLLEDGFDLTLLT